MRRPRSGRILLLPLMLLAAALGTSPISPTSPAISAAPNASAPGGVERAGITYGSAVTAAGVREDLALDLFLPTAADAPRAAVVLAHGGGFRGGNRKDGRIRRLALALAQRGYVVASISYRLRPKGSPGDERDLRQWLKSLATQPEAVRDAQHDFQAAVRYLRRRAASLRIDPDRIVGMGSSAGAITALEAAFNPEDPGGSGSPGFRSDVAAVVALWGASHASRIEPGAPPVLMFHGVNDKVVPFALALQTCAVTTARGNHCEGHWWRGDAHSPWERTDEIVAATDEFLARRVG